VLESSEERRDALVLRETSVGETVERVRDALRDRRFRREGIGDDT